MQIRIKRVICVKGYGCGCLGGGFVNGSIARLPREGESMTVQFDRFGWGTWHTSPVVSRTSTKTAIVIKTKNSVYHLKLGWGEN